MMNRYLIHFDYLLLNDKEVLNFFHHKHLEMHQVQEESKQISNNFFQKILLLNLQQ